MAWMVYTGAALSPIETTCHFDGLAHVEIENVVAVLRGLEVPHGACDIQDVELVGGARVWRRKK